MALARAALTVDSPVRALPQVKPADARNLEKLGVHTIRDLLMQLPRDWEAYRPVASLAEVRPGAQVRVEGKIHSIHARVSPYQRMKLTEAVVTDDRGGSLKVVWFNQPFVV